jgi:hypothetical protein
MFKNSPKDLMVAIKCKKPLPGYRQGQYFMPVNSLITKMLDDLTT